MECHMSIMYKVSIFWSLRQLGLDLAYSRVCNAGTVLTGAGEHCPAACVDGIFTNAFPEVPQQYLQNPLEGDYPRRSCSEDDGTTTPGP